jgi:hydroxyacylglutathione hydrolase
MESFKSSQVSNWSVYGIPAFQDNYLWAIVHEPSKACMVVDPGCSKSVQGFLDSNGYHLSGILITHHHMDHVGGLDALLSKAPKGLPVYGPASGRVAQVNRPVREGDSVDVHCLVAQVIEVPGHTLDHLAYVIELKDTMKSEEVWMFPGDTLFSGGCGRLFEGNPQQMFESLQKLNQFPANTRIFCAHEYTASNMKFARAYAPDSKDIEERESEVIGIRRLGLSTIPTTLEIERSSNLFLKDQNSIEFKQIRSAKDNF